MVPSAGEDRQDNRQVEFDSREPCTAIQISAGTGVTLCFIGN